MLRVVEFFFVLPQAFSSTHLWSLDLTLSIAFSCSSFFASCDSKLLPQWSVYENNLMFRFLMSYILLSSSSCTSHCYPRAGGASGIPAVSRICGSTHLLRSSESKTPTCNRYFLQLEERWRNDHSPSSPWSQSPELLDLLYIPFPGDRWCLY